MTTLLFLRKAELTRRDERIAELEELLRNLATQANHILNTTDNHTGSPRFTFQEIEPFRIAIEETETALV